MEYSLSSKVNSSSPRQEIPAFYGALSSSQRSKQPQTCPCPQSDPANPCSPTPRWHAHNQFGTSCNSVLITSRTSTLSCELPSNNKRLLVISSQWLLYGHPTCKERFEICYNVLVRDMLMRQLTLACILSFTVQSFPWWTNMLQLCEKCLCFRAVQPNNLTHVHQATVYTC